MKPNFKTRYLPLAASVSCVFATHLVSADMSEEFENVTVTATRAEREINEIAANVTAISAERVDAIAANNIRDLLRYEPGVNVEGSGRYGLSNINIRGINGDRVLMLLDNVPVADGFSFGPNLSARRDFVDVDLIKQVQVIRGPASTLYGSDAIGGVVAFVSKDPVDLMEEGDAFAARLKTGYVSQSNETYINAQLAGLVGDWQWLVNAGYRDTSETESFFSGSETGAEQQSANPQNGHVENGLVKLIWSPDTEHRLAMVAETFNSESTTDLTSDIGNVVYGTMTIASTGDDERSRDRFSIQYRYQPENHWLHRLSLSAYSQTSETLQLTELERTSLGQVPLVTMRSRNSSFEQDSDGALAQADFMFSGLAQHYLIAGVEWQQTDSKALREGLTLNKQTGEVVPESSIFPARDFPLSTLTEYAFFVQDEIQLLDKTLTLSPGIRYDKFELDAKLDPLFTASNPGVLVADYDDSEFSAKLGAVYDVSESASLWLQWAQGFRIPPMDDVNVGFTNFAGGYTSLANPDLKPERVDSYELGWRQTVGSLSLSVSAYLNRYEDFIESLASRGFNPQTNLLEFQARNIDDVEIKGVDVSVDWQIEDWQVRLSSSLQNSEDKATGAELESVLPTQTVLGIQYGQIDDPWRLELISTYISEANALDVGEGQTPQFVAPGATLIDLLAHYQITEDIRINAGIFNITDKQYWFASEVREREQTENLDRFTAPGRNMSVNVVINF